MKTFTLLCCSCLIAIALQAQTSDSLMLYCTFDDVNSITNPVAGPGGTFNANPQTNFTTGQVGNAYFANCYESELVYFPKEVIPPDRGCVEFWGRLYNMREYVNDCWGSCPGFFKMDGPLYTWDMEFNGNDGHGGAGLCGRAGMAVNGGGSTSTGNWTEYYSFSSILGDVNAWHHYALSWDIKGIPGTQYSIQLHIDGIPVGSCISYDGNEWCPVEADVPGDGHFTIIRSNMNEGSVAIDELKIWNYAKTQFIEQAYIFTVLNDQAICKNDSTAFEVKAVGIPPIHYQWQKDGLDIPGASDSVLNFPQVQAEDGGEYRCIATNDYGTDTSNTARLYVEFASPTIIQGYTEVLKYQVATYSVAMQEGHTCEFIAIGGNKIDGTENSITVHWGAAGQGYIKLIETSEIGCKADTNTLSVSIGSLGIDDQEIQSLSVYPNPFKGITTFFYTLTEPSQVTLQIFNAYGKLIDTPVNTYQFGGNQHVQWNAERLPDGVFFCVIQSDNLLLKGKIVQLK
jgi:hypothetical protein